ncbi:MAG: ATP-binding cassette domain-containing protein [Betaproteobacteria bacterium]|jgi:ATP-binding cassette subfamily B protein|nr:ATP-binding cassette domain-containing protein [Betaproteobacteria bacterium]NDE23428.1 ATP-binding cassette domain-containing protein [Betaproteobacteria bacterium]NDF78536.1 ATP-binding cassette domain-containing protein [Betaproteobacteria bacterium]
MNSKTHPPADLLGLPFFWQEGVLSQVHLGENVLAWLEVDLNDELRFKKNLVILTDQRVISTDETQKSWNFYPVSSDLSLRVMDHAGVGTLALHQGARRLAAWRFTLGLEAAVLRWKLRFENHQQPSSPSASFLGKSLQGVEDEVFAEPAVGAMRHVLCPVCQNVVDEADEECPVCLEKEQTPPSTWTLFKLWRFAKPYQWQLLMGFVLTLASTAATLVPPYLTMPLMDDVLIPYQNGKPIDPVTVSWYLLGLLGSAFVAWGLGWIKTYILALVSERIGADLRTTTYQHLLKLSLEYFGGRRTGDLIARIGSETDRINVFLSLHLLDFATDVLMIMMTAIILFSINPTLAVVTLLPLPFIGWLIHVVREKLRTGFEKIDRVWSEVTNVLADTIPGIRVVKAFAQEDREAQRFIDANQHNLAVNDRLNRVWSVFSPTVTLMTEVGLLVVWGFGIWLVSKDQITVGVLTAFLAYIGRFYTRLDSMSRIVSTTQKAASGAKRIFEILDHVSSVPEPVNPVALPKVEGRITLTDASFRYGNRAVIKQLNLDIQPGEMIGLVGHSGSGKSTLVNLMCRFYDLSEGSIALDGVDIKQLKVADYRRHIGLVLQEPFLFFGTIADNIAYGLPDASREDIVAAARAAHAHEFILRMPQGYDSLVGERGQGLSGGERQRISIARALLINPRILILDEATSAVDTETEKEIQNALDNLVRGRTTIAIAHRLSTLRKADRLVVMDKGLIVEEGTHDVLIESKGAYWRLYEAQQRQAESEGAVLRETVTP